VPGRHQRALRQFDRVLLPLILLTLTGLEGGLATWTLRAQQQHPEVPLPADLTVCLAAAALLAVTAFVCFAYGKYASGLAYVARREFLRPVSGVALWAAGAAALATLAALLTHWTYPSYGIVLTALLAGVMWLLAAERLVGWVVDLYRPASRRTPARPVYESRILGLFSQPHGLMDNLAAMVDYQFGLKLSERWLARTMRRAVVPFFALQLITLAALTCLVYIRAHERGLVESWLRPDLQRLEPGLYLRWPWPICRVHRVPAERLQELRIAASRPTPAEDGTPAMHLWQAPQFTESLFLVGARADDQDTGDAEARRTTPASLAAAGITVMYRIADETAYVRSHRQPAELMGLLARRELAHLLASRPADALIHGDLAALAVLLRRRLQAAADRHALGLRVGRVNVDYLQPPPQVAPAYQAIIRAREQRRQLHLEAEQFAVSALAEAEAEANRIRRDAESESETVRITSLAAVDTTIFPQQLAVFRRYPELYPTRAAMDMLETWLQDVRKVVVGTDVPHEVINLELKKIRPDLLSTFEE
jgi:regulator of protease activity HflC (stomatin/prohibitin superfamily)